MPRSNLVNALQMYQSRWEVFERFWYFLEMKFDKGRITLAIVTYKAMTELAEAWERN